MYPHKTSPASDDDSAYSSMLDDSESHDRTAHAVPASNSMRTSQSPIESPAPSFLTTPSATSVFGSHSALPQQPTLFAASQNNHFIASPLPVDQQLKAGFSKDPAQQVKAFLDASIGFTGSNLQIRVLGVPLQKAKSRVETQIKLCLQLVTLKGEKVPHWPYLKLPELLTTRDRQRRGKNNDTDYANLAPEDVIDLQATVVCASDPSKVVQTCSGCIQRELKRMRKKDSGLRQRMNADGDVEYEQDCEEDAMELERRKILLFNCTSVVDFSSGDTILPTRITCYCRHHNEKLAFISLQGITRETSSPQAFRPPFSSPTITSPQKTKGLKRPRQEEEDTGMFSMEGSSHSDAIPSVESMSRILSPMSPQFVKEESMSVGNTPFMPPETAGTTFLSPIGSSLFPQVDLGVTESDAFLNLSPPPAKRQYIQSEEDDFTVSLTDSLLASLEGPMQHMVNPSIHPMPVIGRIIPAEGPMHGGTEITILGNGFYDGLTVLFGDIPAAKMQLWGNSTIICVLPPSAIPGPVPVTFREHPAMSFMPANEVAIFTYKDDSERALMELALQVVGLRMTGKLEDARNVAMRIVTDTAKEGGAGDGDNGGRRRNMSSYAVGHTISRLLVELSGRRTGSRANLELCLLDALISIEGLVEADLDFQEAINLNAKSTKHTLLHLACFSGMTTLAKYLVASGADIDARDSNGFTPLHYAVWSGERSVAMELLEAEASPFLTSVQGLSALGMAKKAGYPAIYEAIKDFVVDPIFGDHVGEEEEEEEDVSDFESESEEEEEIVELEDDAAVESDAATERAFLTSTVASSVGSVELDEAEIYAAPAVSEMAPVNATPAAFPIDEKAELAAQDVNDQLAAMKSLIAEAAAMLPDKLSKEKADLQSIPPLNCDKLKDAPSSLAWLTFPTFTAPQFAPLIALPVQLPALPHAEYWHVPPNPDYLNVVWDGSACAAVAAAQQHVLEKEKNTTTTDVGTLDPPPPYSPPAPTHTAVQPPATPESIQPLPETMPSSLAPQPMPEATPLSTFTSASTPTTTRQRIVGHSQSSFSPSTPFPLPSIVPPPPTPGIDSVDIDSMDDLCDCGAAAFAMAARETAVHELDCRRTVALAAMQPGTVALTGAEYLRKSIDKALILFWIPMMIGVLCLALFRLVATNEDMDNLVAKFVTINTAFLHNLREMLHGLRSHVQNGRGAFNELWNAAAAR
ncbi:hypothetical protein BC829DRAFT_422829 [Chytridium lagenaria]|nr:hypothetical protein BC829DRAFT_422829 [Chytridium lagenaria]